MWRLYAIMFILNYVLLVLLLLVGRRTTGTFGGSAQNGYNNRCLYTSCDWGWSSEYFRLGKAHSFSWTTGYSVAMQYYGNGETSGTQRWDGEAKVGINWIKRSNWNSSQRCKYWSLGLLFTAFTLQVDYNLFKILSLCLGLQRLSAAAEQHWLAEEAIATETSRANSEVSKLDLFEWKLKPYYNY